MIVSQIAACSKNRVIGINGDLPWNLPEDMKFFKDTTKGHIIIMGRKTFDSFQGRILPKRLHIVISRNPQAIAESEMVIAAADLTSALKKAQEHIPSWPEEVFVIGGGEIYKQAMPYTDKIYLTEIGHSIEGDTYFPEINLQEFALSESSPRTEPFPFAFNLYKRIRQAT